MFSLKEIADKFEFIFKENIYGYPNEHQKNISLKLLIVIVHAVAFIQLFGHDRFLYVDQDEPFNVFANLR